MKEVKGYPKEWGWWARVEGTDIEVWLPLNFSIENFGRLTKSYTPAPLRFYPLVTPII